MFIKLNSGFISLVFLLSACSFSLAKGENAQVISQYLKLHQQFRRKMCQEGVEEHYQELLTSYRGKGFYIPFVNNKIDYLTIRKIIPEIKKKVLWIDGQIKYLKSSKKIPNPKHYFKGVEKQIERLLLIKEKNNSKSLKEMKRQMNYLISLFDKMVKDNNFLTNYAYPVDHLKNRKTYEDYKDENSPIKKLIANYTFAIRKIYEDGAYNPDHTGYDRQLRTVIDTLYFQLKESPHYFTENLRYDFEFVIKELKEELVRGRTQLIIRMQEWKTRTSSILNFYQELLLPQNKDQGEKLAKELNSATKRLKEYVYAKELDAYLFWKDQKGLYQKLFVLETILYNEVGPLDPKKLERRDVAQVVYNRVSNQKYNYLEDDQPLYDLLKEQIKLNQIEKSKWLNVMFKEGEFSFTYHFIPGVVKIFCSDISPKGKRLQRENLQIALETLSSPRLDFTPTRYFSRASMVGRINMASVWDKFVSYAQRPGNKISQDSRLLQKLRKRQLEYLYLFKDPQDKEFRVYRDDQKTYVVSDESDPSFFSYRNPHYFSYFDEIEASVK